MNSPLASVSQKNLIFVEGKGGVGKSSVAEALARTLAERDPAKKVLLVLIEDPILEPGTIRPLAPNLFRLNNESMRAFEEYAGLKIGVPALVKLFLQNRLMQYLAKAAPGVRELVLMGKIWFERKNFDHVVVDMPATGHGITMFQAILNWGNLFGASALARDATDMIATFGDPAQTGHVIVSLPEEMPLVESLELRDRLLHLLPRSLLAFVANRVFPGEAPHALAEPSSPVTLSAAEYLQHRLALEKKNLRLWDGIDFVTLPYFMPEARDRLIGRMSQELRARIDPSAANPRVAGASV